MQEVITEHKVTDEQSANPAAAQDDKSEPDVRSDVGLEVKADNEVANIMAEVAETPGNKSTLPIEISPSKLNKTTTDFPKVL